MKISTSLHYETYRTVWATLFLVLAITTACDNEVESPSSSSSERPSSTPSSEGTSQTSGNPICPTLHEQLYFTSVAEVQQQYFGALAALIDRLTQAQQDRSMLRNDDWIRLAEIAVFRVMDYSQSIG